MRLQALNRRQFIRLTAAGAVGGSMLVSLAAQEKPAVAGWDPARPLALINDRAFAPGDEGRIRLADTNLTLRCVSVQKDRVRIRILSSGEEQELVLKQP